MNQGIAHAPLTVVVVGTGTDVGKTWVSAALIREWRRLGATVAVRKPTESYTPEQAACGQTDSAVLAEASGESPEAITPPSLSFSVALAPPLAAEELGLPAVTMARLLGAAETPPGRSPDIRLVELVGGVCSPIVSAEASRGYDAGFGDDCSAMISAMRPELVILVADAGLGTIDAVRRSVLSLGRRPLVILNRFDPEERVHALNAAWLRERDHLDVFVDAVDVARAVLDALPEYCAMCGDVDCRGACRGQLESPHYCERCGRRLRVWISPLRNEASCREHGATWRRPT